MAETTTAYVDLSPVTRAVGEVSKQISAVGSKVNSVDAEVKTVKHELDALRRDFVAMIEENRKTAALQKAITEIIRVRQELERDYGNYKLVRDAMIGILKAGDNALVHESTMANISEELMITTPDYWLAPVLIAISAWMADNRNLAERALKEALNRDKEKTCLVFALICRRIGKEEANIACLEWLAKFFKFQQADDMKESIIAYIDAYTNGVFGEDRDNLCEEYITHWMTQLKEEDPDFENDQIRYWKTLFIGCTKNTAPDYPALSKCAPADFAKINDQLCRVNAVPTITRFFTSIMTAQVDKKALVDAIDNELMKLVTNYDDKEAPLREEEEYYTDIKKFNGDEKFARARRAARRARREDKMVNLAERLSEVVASNEAGNVSAKKTAIHFLKDYIHGAMFQFITEKKADYPQEVSMTTHNYNCKITPKSDSKKLSNDYEKTMNGKRQEALSKIKLTPAIIFAVVALLGLVACIVGFAVPIIALGVVGLLVCGAFAAIAFITFNKNKKKKAQINKSFDDMILSGKRDIETCIAELIAITKIVNSIDTQETCNKLLLTEGM